MKAIYKYEMSERTSRIELPVGAVIRRLALQGPYRLFIWAEVDTEQGHERRVFKTFSTGEDIGDEPLKYIGAVETTHGLVWHIYEEPADEHV